MCLHHKSESGCKYRDTCKFLHTVAGGRPSKKSKKGGAKGLVALLKETTQLGCASHDSSHRKSILRENGKLGSNPTVKFSKATMRRVKNLEKKGPSQGIIQQCEPQERNPWAPKLEERTQDETPEQERRARRDVWDWQRMFTNSKKESKDTFHSPAEAWVMLAPSSTKRAERHFVIDSGAFYARVK